MVREAPHFKMNFSILPHRLGFWALVLTWLLSAQAWAQIETANGGITSPYSPELKIRAIVMPAQESDMTILDLSGSFGLNPKNEIRVMLPYVFSEHMEARASGLGDVGLRYKHLLHGSNAVMSSDRFSLLVDAVAPTGNSDHPDLPPRAQLGLGTPQLGLGLVYSAIRDRHRASVELGHLQPFGNGYAGTTRLNLAYWYRLTPAEFPEGEQPTEVRGVVELLGELRGPEFGQNAGTLVYFAPGLQIYASSIFQLEMNARIPIAQSLDDGMGDRQVGGSLAAKFRF